MTAIARIFNSQPYESKTYHIALKECRGKKKKLRFFVPVSILFLLLVVLPLFASAQQSIHQLTESMQAKADYLFELKVGAKKESKLLLQQIDTTQRTARQVRLILDFFEHQNFLHGDKVFDLLYWARSTSKFLGDKVLLNKVLLTLGDKNRSLNGKISQEMYKEVLKTYEEDKNLEGVAHVISRIGLLHFAQADYVQSLEFLFESLDRYKELEMYPKVVTAYHNIGDVYRKIADSTNAIKYIGLSSKLEKRFPQPGIRAMNNSFLGQLYLEQGRVALAKEHLLTSMKVIQDSGELPYLLFYNIKDLAIIEEKQRNYEQAYNYYELAFKRTDFAVSPVLLDISAGMGRILTALGEPEQSVALMTQVLEKVIKKRRDALLETDKGILSFYEVLSKAYMELGDYEKANFYANEQLAAMRAINKVAILNSANTLEKKYQSKLDKQEISLLKDKELIQRKNFLITTIGLAGFILLLLFGIWSYVQRNKSLQRKQELSEMALQNEQMKAVSLKKENEIAKLKFALEQKKMLEKVRHKISADLHDDVGSVLTGLSMQSELLKLQASQKDRKKLNRISQLSKDAMLKMRDTVWALDSSKDTVADLIDRIKDFSIENLSQKNVSFSFITEGLEEDAKLPSQLRQNLYLIAKEAVANILKHSNASKADFSLVMKEGQIIMQIRDDGRQLKKSIPTSGLGLSNMRKRATQLNGVVHINTNKGFDIRIKIPSPKKEEAII